MVMRAWARPTVGGEQACAAALTVGLIFWLLFDQAKSNGKIIKQKFHAVAVEKDSQ